MEFGSSPIWKDHDKDGLTDDKEREHGTDPENPDTDEDGINDGAEPEYGFNPKLKDTDGNGTSDGEEIITVTKRYEGNEGSSKPEAVIRLKGAGLNKLTIERDDPKTSIWMPEDVPGLIDAAYDFNASADIEEAEITFYFDEKYTEESEDFYPAIYYVDTEKQELVLLEEQSIDWANHKVTGKTEHFSKYVLLNKRTQDIAWEREILTSGNINTGAVIEAAFVIDESWSMEDNDRDKIRVDVVKKFIETLRTGDSAAIIGFWSGSDTYQKMSNDLEAAKESLSKIENTKYGTNLSAGLEKAMAEFPDAGDDSETKEKAMKLIVFLTDGQGAYDEKYEQMATERGVKIYTVGLGKIYDADLLRKISWNTGGKHYHANHADDLIEEFRQLTRDTIDIVTDSDGDGLSDYHEERIRLFNGRIIQLDKAKADTDGDGLKDGEEITQRTDKQGRVYFSLYAYPNSIDSDNDRINDKEDELPLVPYTIDYLGSPVHLKSVEEKVEEKKDEETIAIGGVTIIKPSDKEAAGWACEFMMEDYDNFLAERGVETEGKHREDYWQDDWDEYWEDYCDKFNNYVLMRGAVNKKIHYFRNNLNRAPKTLGELKRAIDKAKDAETDNEKIYDWDVLPLDASIYHMYDTNGEYNMKFVSSPGGHHEGVYSISEAALKSGETGSWHGWRLGVLLTEKNDSVNMGTYNYVSPNDKIGHGKYDVMPWGGYLPGGIYAPGAYKNVPNEPSHGASKVSYVKLDTVYWNYHNYVRTQLGKEKLKDESQN